MRPVVLQRPECRAKDGGRSDRRRTKDAVRLLDQTLSEEKKTDDALTKLAGTEVNAEAA
jgi:Domain of unknown function (DUF892)